MTESIDLEFIAGQAVQAAKGAVIERDGEKFFVTHDSVEAYRPDNNAKRALTITTLAGVKRAIETKILEREAVSVNVISPRQVVVYGHINKYGYREVLADLQLNYDDFEFGRNYSREEMIVALQSKFANNDDRNTLLKFISNVQDTNEQNYVDDGVTQTAKATTGVSSLSNVVVPNPVTLRPFRTFSEVKQPESDFVFRMNNKDSFVLLEADGGIWQRKAITNIGEFLTDNLKLSVPVIY